MVDTTDDWWNDKEAFWIESPPPNRTEYRIMRALKEETASSPGFTIQWKVWAAYATQKGRDDAITKLARDHPKWRLKSTVGNPYLERVGGPIPASGINKV